MDIDNNSIEPFELLIAHNKAMECVEQLRLLLDHNPTFELEPTEFQTTLQHLMNILQLYFKAILQYHDQVDFYTFPIVNILEVIKRLTIKPKTSLVSSKTVSKNKNRHIKTENTEFQDEMLDIVKTTLVKPTLTGLKDIAGLSDLKKQLRLMFILPSKQPQLFIGQKICRSVLLYGPPGVGKTQLAYALAAEANADLYFVTASTLLGAYLGDTEKMIEVLFTFMKNVGKMSILFIDEIDGLCRKRNEMDSDQSRRLKTELLTRLSDFGDYLNAFLICATNCPWDLDTGFLRRFQKRLYVALPDRDERLELFKLNCKDTPIFNDFYDATSNYTYLLDLTERYSGSDIRDLVSYALTKPITELEDVNVWKFENGFYTALNNLEFQNFSENIRFCSLDDLPDNSAKARSPDVNDIIEATKTVASTVSLAEIEKFQRYVDLDCKK